MKIAMNSDIVLISFTDTLALGLFLEEFYQETVGEASDVLSFVGLIMALTRDCFFMTTECLNWL